MFEDVDSAGLITAIAEACRAEAAAASTRLAAIAELATRAEDPDDPRELWACDVFDSVAAQVGAAMTVTHPAACGQIRIAQALRDRLPRVAALLRRGAISAKVATAISWRTRLVSDPDTAALIDTALAQAAASWGPMTSDELIAAADAVIAGHDPAALISARTRTQSRDIQVGHHEDQAGECSVWGRLLQADAALFDAKLNAMIANVRPADPRTRGQRRSDAVGALSTGHDYLPCQCRSPSCPTPTSTAPPAVLIHVVADPTAITAAHTENTRTSPPDKPRGRGTQPPRCERGVAALPTGQPIPTPMLAALLAAGANVRPLRQPDQKPQQRYRPSTTLARFIRARDRHCRFPGCTAPAELCDIDHVVPYPAGPTHPSNLACLCRKHHLLKTFWSSDWTVSLRRDGAATWTSPTGHTYTTHPGCRTLFPAWDPTTAELPPSPTNPPKPSNRSLKMPLRTHTRNQDRAQHTQNQRHHNTTDPPF